MVMTTPGPFACGSSHIVFRIRVVFKYHVSSLSCSFQYVSNQALAYFQHRSRHPQQKEGKVSSVFSLRDKDIIK